MESPVARGLALAAAARGDNALAKRYFAQAVEEARRAGAEIVAVRIEAEAGATHGSTSSVRVTLVKEGDFWTVSGFDGAVRIKDTRGVRMLAKLLGTPNREWHALDLAEAGEVVDAGDAGEVLDKQAVDAYRRRLGELERDRDEAEAHHDPGRLARVRAEIEALESELSRGVGLGGRARRAGQASERARVNVQRRLTEALKRIEDAHPPLGAHLRRAIRTGVFSSYAAERDVPSIVTP